MDRGVRRIAWLLLLIFACLPAMRARAQDPPADHPSRGGDVPAVDSGTDTDSEGFTLPNSRRLHVRLDFMLGFSHDDAQAELGLANQGQVGYAKITFAGQLNDRVSYRVVLNPVMDNQPEAACGEAHYFFPNQPSTISVGPTVACEEDGNQRVDMYKYEGLDPVVQQGPMREAYVRFKLTDSLGLQFGRLILPVGFDWEEMGSFTSKDAPRIQRINAESDFGAVMKWDYRAGARKVLTAYGGVNLGDGHRDLDYNYYYFVDQSLDSKNRLTAFGSAIYAPTTSLEVRGAVKIGVTGSKVERLPNFWAAKRNDDAITVSARYRPVRFVSVFAEGARYTWGLYPSAAGLLNMDQSPINKSGYYLGVDAGAPVWRDRRLSTVITREELSRDDSLVKYLASQDLYDAAMGKKDRSTVVRIHFDVTKQLTIGVYHNWDSTPFPWLSGIDPVTGPGALARHSTDKWGLVTRVRLP